MADIVIIDDDPKMRGMLIRILQSAGHTVRAADDGDQGLKLFLEAEPALVITDIVMPKKEGIETIQSLRRLTPTLPILAISGNGREGYLRFAMELGATAALDKPFDSEDLLSTVATLLAGSAKGRR